MAIVGLPSAIYDNSAGQSYNGHRFTLGGGIAGGENVALTIRDSQISGNRGIRWRRRDLAVCR